MSLAPAPKKILTRLSSLQKLLSRSPLSSTSRSLAKSSGLQRSRPQTLAAIHLRLSLRGERRQRREGGEGGARVRQRKWGSILQGNIIKSGGTTQAAGPRPEALGKRGAAWSMRRTAAGRSTHFMGTSSSPMASPATRGAACSPAVVEGHDFSLAAPATVSHDGRKLWAIS